VFNEFRCDHPCGCFDAGICIAGHVIEDLSEDSEGGSLVVMSQENLLNDGCQGTDAGVTSCIQRFVVSLPSAGQKFYPELFPVGQLLTELSTMEIQLVA
jgi:hypothetical protein